MNAKQPLIPKYVDVHVDFEAMRAQAVAYGIRRTEMPSDAAFRAGPTLGALIVTGFAIFGFASLAFSSLSDGQADASTGHEKYAVSDAVQQNAEALRRSRVWWEGYGRRHLQARRGVVDVTN